MMAHKCTPNSKSSLLIKKAHSGFKKPPHSEFKKLTPNSKAHSEFKKPAHSKFKKPAHSEFKSSLRIQKLPPNSKSRLTPKCRYPSDTAHLNLKSGLCFSLFNFFFRNKKTGNEWTCPDAFMSKCFFLISGLLSHFRSFIFAYY